MANFTFDSSNTRLYGSAAYENGEDVRLTTAEDNLAGTVVTNSKYSLDQNFTFNFDIYLGDQDAAGADGITWFMHNDPDGPSQLGFAGAGLGASGIENGVGIEFDTWYNSSSEVRNQGNPDDTSLDHTSIFTTENFQNLTPDQDLPNLEDGQEHRVEINWDAATRTLSYTIDGTQMQSHTFPETGPGSIEDTFGGNQVYFGASASTGGANNEQALRNIEVDAVPDTDGDGILDDVDEDDDNDGILDVNEAAGDTDGDGIEDRIDLDSDNDGISDLVESGQLAGSGAGSVDTNNDGIVDGNVNDFGIALAANGGAGVAPLDRDNDNVNDQIDLDSDGDGISDFIEARSTADYAPGDGDLTDNDLDGDGVVDLFDSNDGTTGTRGGTFGTPNDDDGDGTPDYLDTDADGDNTLDRNESGLGIPTADNDGDGIGDNIPNVSYANPGGDVQDVVSDMANGDSDDTEADFRSINDVDEVPMIDLDGDNSTFSDVERTLVYGAPNAQIRSINLDTGEDLLVSTTDQFGGPVNGAASSDSNPNLVYYTDASDASSSKAYYYDYQTGTHQELFDLTTIPGITNGTSHNAGDFYNNAYYVGSNNSSNELIKLTLSPDGTSVTSVETFDLPYSSFGDFVFLQEDGQDVAYISNWDNGGRFYKFNLETQEVTPIANVALGQLGADSAGNLYAGNGTEIRLVNKETGETGEVITNTTGNIQDLSGSPFGVTGDEDKDAIVSFTEDEGPINLADTDQSVMDFGENDLQSMTIRLGNIQDGADETFAIGGETFIYGEAKTETVTVDGTDFEVVFDGTQFTVTEANDDNMPAGALNSLVGSITYENLSDDPTTGVGTYRTATFELTDEGGNTSPPARSTIEVIPVNDDPDAVDDSASTDEETAVDIAVLGNDSDPENDDLTLQSYTQPTNGTVTLNDDGTLKYTPNDNFNGNDSFTYTISDGNGGTDTATVNVSVNPDNDPPVAVNDSAVTDEDSAVDIDVLANDTDIDNDDLSVDSYTQPTNGTVTLNDDGTLKYTPNANFNGSDSFTYVVSDGNGGTDTATVNVTVNPENDPPVAVNDSAATDEDSAVDIDVLANDSDIDGDDISVISTGSAQNGTVSINDDGTLKYTPNADFNGTDSFSYTIQDESGATATATVTVTVNPQNDTPVAVEDVTSTGEDQAIDIDVVANDTDVDGDDLSVDSYTQPTNGTVTENPDGTLKYTPDANFNGTDTFSYVVTDGNGGTDTTTVTVTVNPENDPPVAVTDTATTDEDSAVDIDVLANDSDLDGDDLSIDSYEQPANGTVTLNDDGTLKYTPNANFNGSDSFTYTISDGNGGTDTATVNVTVNPQNDPPVAVDDTAETGEDSAININVLANDTDLDGDDLSVDSYEQPANGTVTLNDDGTLKYTPNANFNGTDSFTYTISDGNGGTDTATVNVTVNAENDPPVAVDDTAETNEDVAIDIDVLANDSDLEGDEISVIGTGSASNGVVEINDDGTVKYTPNADFNGTDSFSYTIQDENGATATATVTVEVNPINDSPIAVTDIAATDEDSSVDIDVLANDTDLDGDDLSIDSFQQPANGTVTLNDDGTLKYTPDANFNGSDSFTYIVTDGNGGTDTATVNVTVNPENDPPVAVDDTAEVNEDAFVDIDVLANDTDLDGDDLTVTEFTSPQNGTIIPQDDGTLRYVPNADYNGPDSFTYTISDGNGGTSTATVNLTVNPQNDPPIAVNDSTTTPEDTPVNIDVLSNDSDADGDPLTVVGANSPNGEVVIEDDGTLTFTPEPDFNGPTTITYTVSDGNGGFDTAEVTVNVGTVDDAPVALPDASSTDEDSSVVLNVLGNDYDVDGDPLTVVEATVPAEQGSVEILDNGDLKFTPAPDFNGDATISYTIDDGTGLQDSSTATVEVRPLNDAPVAEDDASVTDEDAAVDIDVIGNDSDVDGDPLRVDSFTQPENGTVTLNDDGTLRYTPNLNYNGPDSFTYVVTDDQGGTDTATVNLTVNPVNDPPVALDDTAETDEDTAVIIDVLANDTDVDGDALTITEVTVADPETGTAEITDDGKIKFTPAPDYNGPAVLNYAISDGNGGSDTAQVNLTVNPVNDPPVAVDDSATVDEDTPVTIDVLANDTDADGDPLTVTEATSPDGEVVINDDGTITFTPAENFNGDTTVTYTVDDGNGGTATATVDIEVLPVNDNPVAVDDKIAVQEGDPITYNILDNDYDVDGDDLTVTSIGTTPEGAVCIAADGSIEFKPNDTFDGETEIEYTISDGNGGTATGTVTICVIPKPSDGIVSGTSGDDIIDTDYVDPNDSDKIDNEDAILPGAKPNDDVVEAGDGDDTVLSGEGSDTVYGGDGNDTIDTSNGDPLPDLGYPGLYPADEDPDDDKDTVYGGDGWDTIKTGDDADFIDGGTGNDTIDGGIDNDTIQGGDGNDFIIGGEGSDIIRGGAGSDVIYAGLGPDTPDVLNIEDDGSNPFGPDLVPENGKDQVYGGDGNDTIYGADDDDRLFGDAGNDTIDGGIDDDVIDGGTGRDKLIGGQGEDVLFGREGKDTLIGGEGADIIRGGADEDRILIQEEGDGYGDQVFGGGNGERSDYDTLDLRGSIPPGGSVVIDKVTDSDGNGFDGTVTYLDKDGNVAGKVTFENIERIIPCFTPGTLIETARGPVKVEQLRIGDRVKTRDHGFQAIEWIGQRHLSAADFAQNPQWRPVQIRKGALGTGPEGAMPDRDMLVSPQHRMLLESAEAELLLGEAEVLVPARSLTCLDGVRATQLDEVTYIHIMCRNHEIVLADGLWTESFQPGDMSLAGMDQDQRQELLELFPQLATLDAAEAYPAARPTAKAWEVKVMLEHQG